MHYLCICIYNSTLNLTVEARARFIHPTPNSFLRVRARIYLSQSCARVHMLKMSACRRRRRRRRLLRINHFIYEFFGFWCAYQARTGIKRGQSAKKARKFKFAPIDDDGAVAAQR